jgi:hypothetical protein
VHRSADDAIRPPMTRAVYAVAQNWVDSILV